MKFARERKSLLGVFLAILLFACGGGEQRPVAEESSLSAKPSIESSYDDALEFPDPDEIYDQVIAAIGEDRYADMWIDRTVSPSMLRVGVVDPTPADELALDRITGTPTRVTAVDVKYSLNALQRYRDIAAPAVRAASAASVPYGISIDAEINKVLIEMPTVDAALVSDIIRRGVPADAFVITPGYQPPEAL